ncbi:hypothetical protein P3S67_013341 [Capsicum chacoense]
MNDFFGIHEITNSKLNKLCMDESDPMVNAVVRCKHGILVDLQISWSKSNPGRRFWYFPYYVSKCNFFSMEGQRKSGYKI